MSKSSYQVVLEPPIGTSFYRRYTVRETHSSTNSQNPWNVNFTVDYYVYTANKRPDDADFTGNGGRIYVIARYSGEAEPQSGSWGDPPLKNLHFEMNTVGANGLLRQVKTLPGQDSYTENGEAYTYNWDFKQTMNLFKSGGNESQTFTAIVTEDATRRGWKHTVFTADNWSSFDINREDSAKSPDQRPQIFGMSLWEAQSLGKVTMRIHSITYNGKASHGQETFYDLDFSSAALKP